MGLLESKQTYPIYSIPVSEKKPNETEIRRCPGAKEKLIGYVNENVRTLKQLFSLAVNQKPDGPYLCTFKDGSYKKKSYKEVLALVEIIGSGIINLNLIPQAHTYQGQEMKMVGVFSKNREEWLILDLANIFYRQTTVPLYDTLGKEAISYILNHAELVTCFCSKDGFDKLVILKDLGILKNVVCFDSVTELDQEKAQKLNIKLYTWQDIINAGKAQPLDYNKFNVDPEHIFTLSYTSGTTGQPKGAMISQANMVAQATAAFYLDQLGLSFNRSEQYLSYLPMPHVYERCLLYCATLFSIPIFFYQGEVTKLSQDLVNAQPTILTGVPRVFNKSCSAVQEKLAQLTGFKKFLVDLAIKQKLDNLKAGLIYKNQFWDKLVFNPIKERFGGKTRVMISGSAPLSQETVEFLKVVMGHPVLEGYGLTETSGFVLLSESLDPTCGHIGGPNINTEFKIVSIPELNYTVNDKDDQGKALIRGELYLRGASIIKGYYKDPEKTSESIDPEGWLRTGDIVQLLPHGEVKIIDRKKNIFKLQQGEYIAPEKIEGIYSKADGVQEIFVYGDSLQSYCVGIVVPDKEKFIQIARANSIAGSYEELCKNSQLNSIMFQNLQSQGKLQGLFGFEQVHKIYVEPVSMIAHGCMTSTFKIQRQKAKQIFQKILDELYKN